MARPLPIEFPGVLCHIAPPGEMSIGVYDTNSDTNSDELLLDTRLYMIVN